uniref:Calcineurin-like phosphoesterase domain-containing protein n=1 Tax=Hyaloperonospora arabidopsidis (strain Emoy2) TaxID=559515 RepID=M4BUH0_HYAAE
MVSKKAQLTGVVLVLAIIGAIVGVVVVTRQTSSSSTESSGTATSGSDAGVVDASSSETGSSSTGKVSMKKLKTKTSGSSSGSLSITSDPASAKYTVSAFAIGDWGTTVSQDSCCTRSSTFNDYDVNAEDIVASIMDQQASAASAPPKCIISHGDNFYWTGIDSEGSRDSRFTTTFERKYDGSNIKNVPWINVLGNHDYGGASYICSDDKGLAKCSSASELVKALSNKFSWQAEYTSPNDNRWVLKDHFYVYTIEDKASGVSIDIFNVDAGDASTHGAQQTCCQCYGYAEGSDKKCKNVARGDKLCAGGDTEMFDACFDKFTEWSDDSRKQLAKEVAASTATWKIVNSHYSPYAHYDETGMKKWFEILQDSGVQLWMNGHTHGENHDYSSSLKLHFVDNGAGGGIQKESASGVPEFAKGSVEVLWAYGGQEYGFMSVEASEEWLKLQYHTADDSWSFAEDFKSTKAGGVATKHCWYIPLDGGTGKEC